MAVELATVGDIEELARAQSLQQGKKILGITASPARYVQVPDADDPDAVFEFVVDVRLLDGISQAIIAGATDGAVIIQNVLIAHSIQGDIISDINTPVEIELNLFGQLQVVNRAKVMLPALSVRSYSYTELKLRHLAEFDITADGVFDPFGYAADDDPQFDGPSFQFIVTTATALAAFTDLAPIWGVNPFQGVVQTTVRSYIYGATENVIPTEGIEIP